MTMPPRLKTGFGYIYAPVGKCKDNYQNIHILPHAFGPVMLQEAALTSFKQCEFVYGHPIHVSGSHRSCALQTQLHNMDPNRFADPNVSVHPRGLAIDVINPVPTRVREILVHHGWQQARPDDEPWHFSFGVRQ